MSENEVVSAPPEKIEMEVFSDSITMNGVTRTETEERNVNDSSSESDSDSDDGICVTADPITGPTSINLTNVSNFNSNFSIQIRFLEINSRARKEKSSDI